jgi:hypothetical protein
MALIATIVYIINFYSNLSIKVSSKIKFII